MAKHLEDSEKALILELMLKLLPDDIATEEDLRDIALARQELVGGDAAKWSDINWK